MRAGSPGAAIAAVCAVTGLGPVPVAVPCPSDAAMGIAVCVRPTMSAHHAPRAFAEVRATRVASAAEELLDLLEPVRELIDVVAGRIDAEARPRSGRQVEALVERHRAVVAGPDRDTEPVEHLGDVVRVDARQVEWHYAAAGVGVQRAVQLDAGDARRQDLERVVDELTLVVADAVHPDRGQVVDRDAETDGVTDGRRPGLELPRDVVP